jgi:RNA-binding protein NOB1
MASDKPVHTIVLDTGPIIKADPSISSLRARSEQLVTLPSVIEEIKDEATRSRFRTTIQPFLTLRSPQESSVKVISDFARKTGDHAVLSRVDIQLLALTYDLECERNGGDWRLRKAPGEKRINGPNPNAIPPKQETSTAAVEDDASMKTATPVPAIAEQEAGKQRSEAQAAFEDVPESEMSEETSKDTQIEPPSPGDSIEPPPQVCAELGEDEQLPLSVQNLDLSDISQEENTSDSDSEGWITPSNLKKKQEEDSTGNTNTAPEPKVLQVVRLLALLVLINAHCCLGAPHIRLRYAECCLADEPQPALSITESCETIKDFCPSLPW